MEDNKIAIRTVPARKESRERPPKPGAMARFGEMVLRLPRYSMLAYALLRDDRVDQGKKTILWAGVIYLASPIDLIPGIIPVAGQLDDLAAVLLALRTVLHSLPAPLAEEHMRRAGVTFADIDFDLRTVGLVATWLVRKGGALAARGLAAAAAALARRVGLPFGRRPSSRGAA